MAESVALPSSFGRRALFGLAAIVIATVGTLVSLATDRGPDWMLGAMYLLVGTVIVVWAWLTRGRPVLILDDEGIRAGDGELLTPWSEVASVWVVDTRGPFRTWVPLTLLVWTAANLHFARRTGLPPTDRLSRSVPTRLSAEEVADLVRRFVTGPVGSGDTPALRRLLRSLREPEVSGPGQDSDH